MKTGKSETRKDRYGNPLVSDEAFKIGVEAAKKYIAQSDDYAAMIPGRTAHQYLKTSNIYVDCLIDEISDAIIEAGLDPDFDITYQDLDEMIGAATGDEIRIENSKWNCKFDAWTGHQYRGYNPLNA